MVMCEPHMPHMNLSEMDDDSGCLVHTNSFSDSSRVVLNCCRHDDEGFELLESDGEVSQFDSLDNSEGGMSAENFNTLKKGPLVAPIDPPLEFQDSPQTTMLRRSHTSAKGYHEFAQLLIKDILGEAFLSLLQRNPVSNPVTRRTRILSASDPQLNVSRGFAYSAQPLVTSTPSENIYDEPSDSTRNSDDIEVDYYISKQLSASLARKKSSTLSANSQRLSGHSLHSRISSSHNSLATTVTSKVDDTTFITQAMSHDPLMSRQSILDFYNVPLDSDIYALPVDVVLDEAEDEQQQQKGRRSSHGRRGKLPTNGVAVSSSSQYMSKSSEAKRRLFRKAQTTAAANNCPAKLSTKGGGGAAVSSHCQLAAKRLSAPDGLAIGASFNYPGGGVSGALKHSNITNNHKKRGKREKRSSSNSNTHSVVQQLQPAVNGASDSSDIEGGTATDAMATITVQGNAEEGHASKGTKKEVKRRGQKEGRTSSSSKPLTITISKTVTNPSSSGKTSGVTSSSNKEKEREKKATIPISTSFTSQSSMQSNCGAGSGGAAAAAAASAMETSTGSSSNNHNPGKTTKREARDATKRGHSQFSTNLKQKFCSIFRFRNNKSSAQLAEYEYNYGIASAVAAAGAGASGQKNGNAPPGNATAAKQSSSAATIMLRALPPLPKRAPPEVPVTNGAASSESNRRRPPAELPPLSPESSAGGVETDSNNNDVLSEAEVGGPGDVPEEPVTGRVDFASNLETIKQYGWYWGPISCQAAERILSNEPDGSFIVRDSSDDHYIFSLTFKLNNCVRHVRIEQDKGTFSFGTLAKFKARTIVEFIEQALEYSRSGRYLFFLHRRPEHGPMRVQLKNPVSRFKHIQSLQHMCRFVIMKAIVRKDLISSLPLPNRLKDYLSYKNCYTEHFEDGCGGEVEDGPAEVGAMTGNEERTEGEPEQERN